MRRPGRRHPPCRLDRSKGRQPGRVGHCPRRAGVRLDGRTCRHPRGRGHRRARGPILPPGHPRAGQPSTSLGGGRGVQWPAWRRAPSGLCRRPGRKSCSIRSGRCVLQPRGNRTFHGEARGGSTTRRRRSEVRPRRGFDEGHGEAARRARSHVSLRARRPAPFLGGGRAGFGCRSRGVRVVGAGGPFRQTQLGRLGAHSPAAGAVRPGELQGHAREPQDH